MKKKLALDALWVVLVLVIAQCAAWSVVTISWTDSLGPQSVDLTLAMIDPGDPLYAFEPYAWRYCKNGNEFDPAPIEIHMNHTWPPIAFTFTGDYTSDEDGEAYPIVLLEEMVYNETLYNWTDFHLHVEDGEFGWVQGFVNNWSVDSDMSDVSYYMDTGGVPVPAGTGTFYDGVYIYDDFDDANADMVVTKWPTPLPETAGIATLLGGILGMLRFVKRR